MVSCLKASPSRGVGTALSIRETRSSAFLTLHEGPLVWADAAGCRGDTVPVLSTLLLRDMGSRVMGDASTWETRAEGFEVGCRRRGCRVPIGREA